MESRNVKEFTIGKWLGKGACGEVWECVKGGVKFAIKMTDEFDASTKAEEYFANSMKLACPFIVNYIDAFKISDLFPRKMFIVMELCEKGDLQKLINDLNEKKDIELRISIKHVMKIFIQLLIALHVMHSNNIIHRDLKAGNVFVNETYDIKLGDFGFARVLESESEKLYSVHGTPYCMPPEMLGDEPEYGTKADVWSLGVLIYYLCTLKPPFYHPNRYRVGDIIRAGKYDPFPPHSYSEGVCTLFYSMLKQNPDERPSVEKLLLDPLVVSFAKELNLLKFYHPDVLRILQHDAAADSGSPPSPSPAIPGPTPKPEESLFVPHPGCQNNFLLRGNTASVLRLTPNPFDPTVDRAVLFLDKLVTDGLWRVNLRFPQSFGPMGFGVAPDVDGQPYTVGEIKLYYHSTGVVLVDKDGQISGNSVYGFEPLALEIDARAGRGHENTRAVFFVGGVPQPISFNKLHLPLRFYFWWSAQGIGEKPNQVEVVSFGHIADPSPPRSGPGSMTLPWKVD